VSFRLAGSARVVFAAASIVLGAAACGSDAEPAVDGITEPTTTSTAADTTSASTSVAAEAEPGVSEADVTELEQQLDEIDLLLADLEAQLSED
jgi:hypothetical protein